MSKRNSGRNKSRRKQRDYQAHLRFQALAGMVAMADGSWASARLAIGRQGLTRSSVKNGFAGYKIKGEE